MTRPTVLLTDGSSTSARQVITALGRCGYTLDVCDPDPFCIGRFSRYVRRCYRSPAVGTDPLGYLHFVLDRLARERYDVLLPVHEQAFLFAKVRDRLPTHTAVALAGFDAFVQVQGKAAFTRLMEQLALPQPPTRIVHRRADLEGLDRFPYYVKADYSTAGQGVWHVESVAARERVVAALEGQGLLDGESEIVVQDVAPGTLSQVQAVFAQGRLLAVHCTQTRGASLGGGHSARTSVDHPTVREHVAILGRHLEWHGPIALDYLYDDEHGRPAYIEANPRLVEPMNAVLSGLNLPDLVVRVALGDVDASEHPHLGTPGVRSHSLLAIAFGVAAQRASRRAVAAQIVQGIRGRGIYAGSAEDLMPVRTDPRSLIPLSVVLGLLLLRPRAAQGLAAGAIASYSLTPWAVQTILALDGPPPSRGGAE